MAKQLSYLAVGAIIRRGDEVLLVRQQGPGDPQPSWAVPGGRVELGEVLPATLAREVQEETGLTVLDPGRLAYVSQLHNPDGHVWVGGEPPERNSQATAFVFEVAAWTGDLQAADPDGFVQQCRFVPLAEAVDLLETTLPWRVMRDPAVAYLRGDAPPGTVWIFQRESRRRDRLLHRIPGPNSEG